ncbi:cation diffusion facilitator family transporter [Desulfovibrio litoralis]|uniref:Cation diffusion facilitator family transporter n=1 Tax=Desulfovibrio litoralis DSM 11393 TaxID=1121455 RepID=A0A1M7T935_9BACT|nr:cation diffusion facilitator family transporter [Desulfovibrio litoralis]SHN67235.1 cation diffusion facilitator family transporter [Desulfovibrio litoralis DSM 11393]
MYEEERKHETSKAASASVLAALFLTGLKLVVGLSTNSLGILSEALHSSLDLVAAGLTLFAVRYASNPADSKHPYGHGKIENLSAFVEALLLLVTCIWIVYESINRLFFNPVLVEASLWGLGIMAVSIVVDISRARMLMRVAKKHKSQALEADALHFYTDIWSSAVVIVGLLALYLASFFPEGSVLRILFERADALAALGVAAIVINVSFKLAVRAVNILLDAGDVELEKTMTELVKAIPGVYSIERLRLRHSGSKVFADLAVVLKTAVLLEQTDEIRQKINLEMAKLDSTIEITIEFLPFPIEQLDHISKVKRIASVYGLEVHAIKFSEFETESGGALKELLQLHVEVEPNETLLNAHNLVNKFEKDLRKELSNITIISHLEPREQKHLAAYSVNKEELSTRKNVIEDAILGEEKIFDVHKVLFRESQDGKQLSFHCHMPPDLSVRDAHEISSRVQAKLYKTMPDLDLVIIHTEPKL